MTAGPDSFSGAALNDRERRVLDRIVALLREQLGDELLALWLYGSRARGEADPEETDFDLRADVDLLAIIGRGREAERVNLDLIPTVEATADAEGDSPVYYELRFFDLGFLRDRRRIRDFFIQEVDRDKLVLDGGRLDEPGASGAGCPMSPRSEEFIDQARDRLIAVREALSAGHLEGAVSAAYYSMLYAARAALSEDDENARTHRGTWNRFRILYVTTDAFDADLFTRAQHAQVAREAGDYSAVTPRQEQAEEYVEAAGEFLAAVERMLAD